MDQERRAIQDHPQHKLKWWRTMAHSPKHWWENSHNSEDIVAGPSHSTSKSYISEVILSLWRKPRAVNGLLEARAIVPVDNPYGERQLMLPWMLLRRGGYFTQTATGGEVSLSLSSGTSWRKIHVKQAPAMAVVTILDNSLKWSDGVNYRRVKTCWLCCTHCWIKDMFSSYHAFLEYEYCTRQV